MKIFSLRQIKTVNINHLLQDATGSNWSHTLRLTILLRLENRIVTCSFQRGDLSFSIPEEESNNNNNSNNSSIKGT